MTAQRSAGTSSSAPLIVLVLAAAVLVLHARVVLGGKTWDDVAYHTEVAPPRLAAAEALAAGELPQWWEGTGFGVPLLADPGHGAAYPGVWIAATPRALDLVWVAHVLWLALGIALWARRRGTSELAVVLASVLAIASGIVASTALRGALPALAHVPWVGWAATVLVGREHRARALIALGLAIGAIGLTGQLAVLAGAVGLAIALATRRDTALPLAGALVAGLAIACVQWLPAAYALDATAGGEVFALRASRLLELVVPGSFGGSHGAVPELAGAHPHLPSLYVGAPLVALAILARPERRIAIVAGALVVFAGLVGRGGWPAWLGAPDLHVAVLVAIAAPHAAQGFDVLLAGDRRARVALLGAAAITAIALGAIAVLHARTGAPALARALVDGGLGLACLVVACVLAWRARPRTARSGPAPALAAALLVVAPSVGALGSTAPVIDRAAVTGDSPWLSAARQLDTGGAPVRVFRPASLFEDVSPSSVRDAIATLAGTSAARSGIGTPRSADPARSRDHDRVWLAAAGAGGALLDRFGVSLAILPLSLADGRGMVNLATRGNWALVRYPAAPPAAIVYEWIWSADVAGALVRLFPPGAGRGLPPGVLVLAGSGDQRQDEPRAPEPCTITRWTAGAIDLTCAATDPAYAVVSSTSADGWTVHVDGRDTPWVTADVLRRAVVLAPGAHVVSWRYEAPGLALGLALGGAGVFALGVLALGALALLTRRRSNPRTRDRESLETNRARAARSPTRWRRCAR